MRRKWFAYWPEKGSISNQLQMGAVYQNAGHSLGRELWGSLIGILAIACDLPHSRVFLARPEDVAGYLALDRILPSVTPGAVEECKPLIWVRAVRHAIVPDTGAWTVAHEDRALTDVADDAETESLGWNVEGRGHCQSRFEMLRSTRGLVLPTIPMGHEPLIYPLNELGFCAEE